MTPLSVFHHPRSVAIIGASNEWESFKILEEMGIPVVEHVLVHDETEVEQAVARLSTDPVVVKGCTSDAAHKSELGLVKVGLNGIADIQSAVTEIAMIMDREGLRNEGVLISKLVNGIH